VAAIDVFIRAGAASLLLGLAAVLLASRPKAVLPWLYGLLAVGLAGFLAINTPVPALELPDGPEFIAGLLAGHATLFLWWFCLALFDDGYRPGRLELAVGVSWVLVKLADRGMIPSPAAPGGLSWLLMLMGCGMVAHIVWRALAGREDDLVEARRRLRLAVAGLLVAILLADFAADLLLGADWRGHRFAIAQNAAIGLVALGLCAWFLQLRPQGLSRARAIAPRPSPNDPDRRLLARIDTLMTVDRVWLDPGLTLADFARRLGASEAETRRLVHQRLGERHFRTFLNGWRVGEAQRRLIADPRAPMIAVAFDSGFSSLPSFNRVFRDIAGCSPSQYRGGASEPDHRASADFEAPSTRN
jgi:AraC-like DNA-binding protein